MTPYDTNTEALLDADIITVAATTFGVVFTGAVLGQDVASERVRKHLASTFGRPRWNAPDTRVYDAVVLQIILLWERAGVAGRAHGRFLMMLPRGIRLLEAPDPVSALRELL